MKGTFGFSGASFKQKHRHANSHFNHAVQEAVMVRLLTCTVPKRLRVSFVSSGSNNSCIIVVVVMIVIE